MAPPNCEPLCQFDERLFFTFFPAPAPSPTTLNKLASIPGNEPPLGPRSQITPDALYHYFTIDDRLLYFSFFEDWGPLNIAMVYKACILIHELLQELPDHRLVLYSSDDPRKKANAALIMALFMMIVKRRAPWEAFQPIAEIEFIPFRDAGRAPSDFNLNIQDCLWGMWKAMQNGLCDMNEFDVDDYEFFEKVENGDWNWITPHFIAFASPSDQQWLKKEKENVKIAPSTSLSASKTGSEVALQRKLPTPFLNCLNYFEERSIKLVVRLNTHLYDKNVFLERGIDHLDLYFDDGTNPTDEIVRKFLDVADRVIESGGVVAVHCKAGLGRTGSLIGAYLIWKYGFTANEAIAFMRILRPGSVVGPQQQYMYLKQLEWCKWAAVDELLKQQAEEAKAAITPPKASDVEMDITLPRTPPPSNATILPPVTPSRHVATAAAKAQEIAKPPQPRKTPSGKRITRDSDEEEEDDILPLPILKAPVPRLATKSTRVPATRSACSSERTTRVTRSAAGLRRPNVAPPKSPTKGQGPPKIPRLATTTTASAAKAKAVGTIQRPTQQSKRAAPPPTPSKLPTLASNRKATTLNEVAVSITQNKGTKSDAWMNSEKKVSAVVVPGTKTSRPNLRPVRRRRSSFSNADVVV